MNPTIVTASHTFVGEQKWKSVHFIKCVHKTMTRSTENYCTVKSNDQRVNDTTKFTGLLDPQVNLHFSLPNEINKRFRSISRNLHFPTKKEDNKRPAISIIYAKSGACQMQVHLPSLKIEVGKYLISLCGCFVYLLAGVALNFDAFSSDDYETKK